MLSQEQLEQLAALPDIARQELLDHGQGRTGWWIRYEGRAWTVKLYGRPSEGKPSYTIEGGWSWAPCSEALWMSAATPRGWDWDMGTADGEPCARIFENLPVSDIFEDDSPIDCAMMVLRSRNGLVGKSGEEIAGMYEDATVVEGDTQDIVAIIDEAEKARDLSNWLFAQ